MEYDVRQHVPSDLAPGQLFLPPDTFKTQMYNDHIFQWSNSNKMVINQQKSNYMVISRSNQDIATRLNINGELLDRKHNIVHLCMHITALIGYAGKSIFLGYVGRVNMLSKLKYVGVHTEDLITLYSLHIRSVTEYCSTAFSQLTEPKIK